MWAAHFTQREQRTRGATSSASRSKYPPTLAYPATTELRRERDGGGSSSVVRAHARAADARGAARPRPHDPRFGAAPPHRPGRRAARLRGGARTPGNTPSRAARRPEPHTRDEGP